LELLVMERLDGMTQDEIAAVLGVSARTVRRLARKVDQKLARLAPELA
jgi:DNA-directed RNA polymerase specialized sigma24 family protein